MATFNETRGSSLERRPIFLHDKATDVGLLIARLLLGIIFFAHGAQKLFGWFGGYGMQGTSQAFAGMGIPSFLTHVVAYVEFFGGIALVLGLLSRLAALALCVEMIVAMFLVHWPQGFFIAGAKVGIEYTLALTALTFLILCAGPGRYAVGDLEARLFLPRRREERTIPPGGRYVTP
jgi:putative oxidoreductase